MAALTSSTYQSSNPSKNVQHYVFTDADALAESCNTVGESIPHGMSQTADTSALDEPTHMLAREKNPLFQIPAATVIAIPAGRDQVLFAVNIRAVQTLCADAGNAVPPPQAGEYTASHTVLCVHSEYMNSGHPVPIKMTNGVSLPFGNFDLSDYYCGMVPNAHFSNSKTTFGFVIRDSAGVVKARLVPSDALAPTVNGMSIRHTSGPMQGERMATVWDSLSMQIVDTGKDSLAYTQVSSARYILFCPAIKDTPYLSGWMQFMKSTKLDLAGHEHAYQTALPSVQLNQRELVSARSWLGVSQAIRLDSMQCNWMTYLFEVPWSLLVTTFSKDEKLAICEVRPIMERDYIAYHCQQNLANNVDDDNNPCGGCNSSFGCCNSSCGGANGRSPWDWNGGEPSGSAPGVHAIQRPQRRRCQLTDYELSQLKRPWFDRHDATVCASATYLRPIVDGGRIY